MMPGWLVRAVVAVDLMRLVALCLSLTPFIPGCAKNFFPAQRKKCAELTDARIVFLRARSRPIGSVTRSLESFPPSPSLSRESHRKKDSRVGG